MMRKSVLCTLMIFAVGLAKAQYIPAYQPDSLKISVADVNYWHQGNLLKHLEASLTVGTSGIGLDIATPLSEYVQVRVGYDYMPRIHKNYRYNVQGDGKDPVKYNEEGNRVATPFDNIASYMYAKDGREIKDHVDLRGKLTMNNFKLLVDIYPFKYDKSWHITAGLYWGPSEFARMDNTSASVQTLADIQAYNQIYREAAEGDPVKGYGLLSVGMGTYSHNFQQGNNRRLMNGPYQMEPTEDCRVTISCTSNSLKPYVGFGYGGRLFPKRNDWKITGELGAMIWGGSPSQTTHDGTDLSKDVQDYPHTITTIVKNLFVYPVLSVRIAKTLF